MKKILLAVAVVAMILLYTGAQARASEIDVLLTKLVEKNVLTPAEAQIICDETKLQVSKDLSQGKSLSVPEWSQRIKMGGDVRFRTQYDSGKNNTVGRPTVALPGNNNGIQNQQIRQRVRGRFYLEGKVNDFTYAGTRFAGGGVDPRSTNDTLTGYFSKANVMFDQYYIRFEAPSDMIRDYGQYFSDLKLWVGKFNIPFESSELVWDSDINPGGMALQYVSPDIKFGSLPSMNAFSNLGMFWLNEAANINTDPMLLGGQVGLKTDAFGPLDTKVNLSVAFYDFENLKGKTPTITSLTNTRTWIGSGDATVNQGALQYGYSVFDLLVNIDNEKIGDIAFPHGFYGDFIYNPEAVLNKGALVGAYVGKKKLKAPGDWKVRTEWRYIERDAIPDFMPDSDFYGFGTWTNGNNALNSGNNGVPVGGGTNGKGINMALEYQLLKNTTLNVEYYWMKPINSWDRTNPWNEFQLDVITKF